MRISVWSSDVCSSDLYQPGRFASLVEDNRARRVGDVLTIALVERTQASKTASANSSRDSDMSLTLPDAKPFSWVPDGLLSGGSAQSFKGQGGAAQSNQLSGQITVTVADRKSKRLNSRH